MTSNVQTNIHAAQMQWRPFLGFVPFSLLLLVIVLIYSVFRYHYIFWLYVDSVHQPHCYCWWLCSNYQVTLFDGHVQIVLHTIIGHVLLLASIHWDGIKFCNDTAIHEDAEGTQLVFMPPLRLAKHLTKSSNTLKIVGTSMENVAILPTGLLLSNSELIAPILLEHSNGEIHNIYPLLPVTAQTSATV